MTKKIVTRINRGISLLSMAIVLTIVLIAAPVGMQRYASYLEEQDWTVTATHLSTANQAARQYIKDNYDTLLIQVKNGGNVTVTGQTLRDKGYLPAGFSLANNSTQNYILAITRNPSQTDKLVAFVLTAGGQELAFKAQRYIAQNTSGLGGYIYPANIANGASGGWQLNLASMGLSGQTGHLVTYLTSDVLAGGAEESDRLYRFAVNGRPDLNRMHTAIDLNTNNINNGGTISAKEGKFSTAITAATGTFSNDITARNGSFTQKLIAGSDITSNGGWLITKGSKGWLNDTHGGGFYMDDNNWIKSVNGKGISTSGQIKGGSVRSDTNVSVGGVVELDQVNIAGTSCVKNGNLSRDALGATLSCQSGVWMALGGSGFKAPPPQEISCVLPIPNQKPRVRAKVDSNGQIWTTTNNAAWVKGSIANSNNNDYFQINVTLSGIEGFGGYNQSGGGGSSSSNQARCTAAWKY